MMLGLLRRDELTFRANLRDTRYGWLRLTPAYSVHLVRELLSPELRGSGRVLDPFCGTGTTALVCAELGISADTTDINPFLLWLTTAKTRRYTGAEIQGFLAAGERVARALGSETARAAAVPALYRIEKWWAADVLASLARGRKELDRLEERESSAVVDLAKVAFCQTLIARANVSFGHQSMSFKKPSASRGPAAEGTSSVVDTWNRAVRTIAEGAASSIARVPKAIACDARELGTRLSADRYRCVITSPPYPNRMSYIRELRPYMYWLGYLDESRQAGELDWKAIGGTWGSATSRVAKWTAPEGTKIPFPKFPRILARIADKSPVLSRYVEKYFHDMQHHYRSLSPLLVNGGSVHYIIGNSKFYDVLLPAERILLALLEEAGFVSATVTKIRKRSSKKELFEYVVSARKPD